MADAMLIDFEDVGLDDATEEGSTLLLAGLPGFFGLHYLPEVDLDNDAVTGCEALLRWWHPDYGVMSPGAALQHTRWSGHLAGLDRWAVHAAARQIALWSTAGRPMRVALNVSPRSITDPDFRRTIGDALVVSGATPELLGVDVPLAAFTLQPVATRNTTETLANFGITVIADGVSGDAPIAALTDCSISVIKVPVTTSPRHPDGLHPSVGGGLQLAHNLGAVGVAKAVETGPQLRAIRALGFDRAFGHVFSPALSVDGFDALLDDLARPALFGHTTTD